MAHAYTPGLKVSGRVVLLKRRTLPIPGEILVRPGDRVSSDAVVARAFLPGKVHTVNVVNQLSIQPGEIQEFMLKREKDAVRKDEPIAENRPLLKFMRTTLRSSVDGTVESVSAVTGQVLLREPPRPLEVKAYVDGTVVETVGTEGVVVETCGAFAQGIFGLGGETTGPIALAVERPDQDLSPDLLGPQHRGKVVVGGAYAPSEAFRLAREVGLSALVVGGIDDRDLRSLLGYDLGVAITGAETIGFTLILTEGFGRIPMARRTFDLLRANLGRKACVSGATQIRAGEMRPEIIIPEGPGAPPIAAGVASREGLQAGDPIRIIREPYFGRIGVVGELNPEPVRIETEAKVRVLTVRFDDGETVVVPRANVEILET
ncbi:MAG: hypothetical protein HY608_10990 [Planctomycetes bacterium]|nr:hypothetical protein [Planctomycetota bacterium]